MTETLATSTVTTTTLTFPPAIPIDDENLISSMDLSLRYQRIYDFLFRFARQAIHIDRYMTAVWLPCSLLGCFLAFCVFFGLLKQKSPNDRFTNDYSTLDMSQRSQSICRSPSRTFNIYMTSLTMGVILKNFFLVLIDLDEAWNTSILAWSHFACVIIRVISTTLFTWIPVLLLLQGCHTYLSLREQLKTTNFGKDGIVISILKKIIIPKVTFINNDKAESFKSLKIIASTLLVALLFGLVEFAFWNINYLQIDPVLNLDQSLLVDGSDPGQESRYQSIPFCDVSTTPSSLSRILPKLDDVILNEKSLSPTALIIRKTSMKKTSQYLQYNWVKICIILGPIAIGNIIIGVLILKLKILKSFQFFSLNQNSEYQESYRHDGTYSRDYSRRRINSSERKNAKLSSCLCLSFGLAFLPLLILTLLSPLAHPVGSRFTDKEIERDPMWRQFFLITIAIYFSNELALVPCSFVFPACYFLNEKFKNHFHNLLGCPWVQWTRPKVPSTLIGRRLKDHLLAKDNTLSTNEGPYRSNSCLNCPQCASAASYNYELMKQNQNFQCDLSGNKTRRYSEEILSSPRGRLQKTQTAFQNATSVSLNMLNNLGRTDDFHSYV